MKNTIFMVIIIAILISCGKSGDGQNLTELLGKDVQSPEVKSFLLTFKDDRNSSRWKDVREYKSKGIEMHFDSDKVLQQIRLKQVFLYSGKAGGFGKYIGELPYNLSFDDTPAIVRKKLGEVYKKYGSTETGFKEQYKDGQILLVYNSDPKTNDAIIERISIHPRD